VEATRRRGLKHFGHFIITLYHGFSVLRGLFFKDPWSLCGLCLAFIWPNQVKQQHPLIEADGLDCFNGTLGPQLMALIVLPMGRLSLKRSE
jgi:hypothetical protein